MISKQSILDQLAKENATDEDLMAIIAKYPDSLSDEDVNNLDRELQEFAADEALLAKAYEELADDFGNTAEMISDELDKAIIDIAKSAHDDLTWANEQLSE